MNGVKYETCPHCLGALKFDVQLDSIYVSCNNGDFEVSTFRDKFSGDISLYYLNNGDEGGIGEENLKMLQDVLYRNNDIKKQLFSLSIKNQIF
ncbi:MAG: hypothetical protein GY870_03245 [archaeon]|nr:hypothetical protein [archaeon]